jgi:hypothetical protein
MKKNGYLSLLWMCAVALNYAERDLICEMNKPIAVQDATLIEGCSLFLNISVHAQRVFVHDLFTLWITYAYTRIGKVTKHMRRNSTKRDIKRANTKTGEKRSHDDCKNIYFEDIKYFAFLRIVCCLFDSSNGYNKCTAIRLIKCCSNKGLR